jgi:hypothetical protein
MFCQSDVVRSSVIVETRQLRCTSSRRRLALQEG